MQNSTVLRSTGQRLLRASALTFTLLGCTLAASSCTSDSADAERIRAKDLGGSCFINSDCNSPLVCAFKRCHNECETSDDCPSGERCVPADRPFNVCLLEDEVECKRNTDCPAERLLCGPDNECREACSSNDDCLAKQQCVEGSTAAEAVCADDTEIDDGKLPAPENPIVPCVYNSDCEAPLLCKSGACRTACKEDRDCTSAETCTDGACMSGPAPLPQCSNGVQDNDETDVDCGGSCGGCPGDDCTMPNQCASRICEDGKCAAPSCTDGTQNSNESDTDCGGACPPCGAQQGCFDNGDCTTGTCDMGRCTSAQCSDGQKGENETDVDCGGTDCPPCAAGAGCLMNTDCTTGNCVNDVCVPDGPVAWTVEVDTNGPDTVLLDADPSGDVVVAGMAFGKIDFGTVVLESMTGAVYLAKRTPAGATVWATFVTANVQGLGVKAMAVDSAGDIVLALDVHNTNGPLASQPGCAGITGRAIAIAKYSGSTPGQLMWATCAESKFSLALPDVVAVDASDNVWFGGAMTQELEIGRAIGGPFLQTQGKRPFLAKLNAADGTVAWATAGDSTGSITASVTSLAADGQDMIVGGFTGLAFDFGTGTPVTVTPFSSQTDAFVLRVSPAGAVVGAPRVFGGTGSDRVTALALEGGALIAVGKFASSIDLSPTQNENSEGGTDVFMMRLSLTDLSTTWANTFGSTADDEPRAVAIASNGEIALTGTIGGPVVGDAALTHQGSADIFLTRYNASGDRVYSKSWGGILGDEGTAIAYSGTAVVLGGRRGSSDIEFWPGQGSLPLNVLGQYDGFATFLPF